MNNENVTVSNDQILSGNIDNLAVSYADRITNPKTVSTPFSSIIKQIQESDDLAQKIASIRKLTTADERREAKQRLLPYFCGSLFKNGERNNSAFE